MIGKVYPHPPENPKVQGKHVRSRCEASRVGYDRVENCMKVSSPGYRLCVYLHYVQEAFTGKLAVLIKLNKAIDQNTLRSGLDLHLESRPRKLGWSSIWFSRGGNTLQGFHVGFLLILTRDLQPFTPFRRKEKYQACIYVCMHVNQRRKWKRECTNPSCDAAKTLAAHNFNVAATLGVKRVIKDHRHNHLPSVNPCLPSTLGILSVAPYFWSPASLACPPFSLWSTYWFAGMQRRGKNKKIKLEK